MAVADRFLYRTHSAAGAIVWGLPLVTTHSKLCGTKNVTKITLEITLAKKKNEHAPKLQPTQTEEESTIQKHTIDYVIISLLRKTISYSPYFPCLAYTKHGKRGKLHVGGPHISH